MKRRLEEFIRKLLSNENIEFTDKNKDILSDFAEDEDNISAMQIIIGHQEELKKRIMSKLRIFEIQNQHIQIPNATVGKEYSAHIDFIKLGFDDFIYTDFEGLEDKNLVYDNSSETIFGIPNQSGDFKIKLKFRISGEAEDSELNFKNISLVINADPKSLWKNLPSDKQDEFWKEDDVFCYSTLGEKSIIIASKRGRSHANVGSFRDDDYSFKHFDKTGWSLVAVSDGAGSAKFSRKGSEVACKEVVNYFDTQLSQELTENFDHLLENYTGELKKLEKINNENEPENHIDEEFNLIKDCTAQYQNEISKFIYNNLGGCARAVHSKLEKFALTNNFDIKDLHSTLIFSLFKKYEFGYVILSFGVGDCPIGILDKDCSSFKLMNWLDVGEYGGGTRFITMPEIFVSDKFSTRFGFKILDDFSYLMLMTDGIYDAKFVVESNLEKLEKWQEFILDLKGNNEDKVKIDFDNRNIDSAQQLSKWMDFWSPGNHDDRTLAIIY